MANQNAIQDDNHFPALIGHSGTAGTAETRRIITDGDGSIYVNVGTSVPVSSGLITSAYDYIARGTPDGTTVTYTHKIGGSSGTVVGTISVYYTDTTLSTMHSVYAQNV